MFPEEREAAIAMHARARAGHRVEVPRHAKVVNGRERWWEGTIDPVPMEGGTGLLITAREITARLTRRNLAQRLQLALDAALMGWWQYDPVTRIATYDERYKEIFGVSGQERPNEEMLKLIHPDDFPRVWAAVEAALNPADPKPYSAEYRVNHPDGTVRWVEAHGLSVFEGEGAARRATGLVGTVTDITERKRAEEALGASEARFRSVLEESRDVIYRLNLKTGRYEYISPSAKKVVGFSPDELMALDVEAGLAMIHPDDVPAVLAVTAGLEASPASAGRRNNSRVKLSSECGTLPLALARQSYPV